MKLSVRFSDAKQMKHVVAIAVACSVLFLPGCIPNLRNPEPGLNRLPEGFRGTSSPDNSAKVNVEEFYTDPMLICLIHQAMSPIGNRELKIMNERCTGQELIVYDLVGEIAVKQTPQGRSG